MARQRPIKHIAAQHLATGVIQIAIDSVDAYLTNPDAWYRDATQLIRHHPDEERLQQVLYAIWDVGFKQKGH